MMRERHLRYLAALLIIGLAFYTVSSASTILSYALADLSVSAANAPQTYAPFVDQPTVAYLARARMLQLAASSDPAQRADDIKDLLAQTPADGHMWLELAKAQAAQQVPPDRLVKPLAMSSLTGPNEGRVMAERVLFMAPLWNNLPADSRRGISSDLLGGWGSMSMPQKRYIGDVLKSAPEEEKHQIAAGLLLAGKEGTALAKTLDLLAAPAESKAK